MLKRLLVFVLIAGLALPLSGAAPVSAAPDDFPVIDVSTFGSEDVSGAVYSYVYSAATGILTIQGEGPYVITSGGEEITGMEIVVDPVGPWCEIVLQDAVITNAGSDKCAFALASEALNVHVYLEGTNILTSGENCAGLQVPEDSMLQINGVLGGNLTATGGLNGAGIGGGTAQTSGQIYIDYATVRAIGGGNAAGIGGGASSGGPYISIADSTVTATGGTYGAGIGGGHAGGSNYITIDDSRVEATGGAGAAGIGGGRYGDTFITLISGEDTTVVARGGEDAAGIGNGEAGDGSSWDKVDIHGGATVIAIAGDDEHGVRQGAGIGGGLNTDGLTVTIREAMVTAVGSDERAIGAGIGGLDDGTLDVGLLDVGLDDYVFDPFERRAVLTLDQGGVGDSLTLGTCTIAGDGAGPLAGLYVEGQRTIDLATVNAGGEGYTFSDGVLSITGGGPLYIMTSETTENRILVDRAGGSVAQVYARALDISTTTAGACAFALAPGTNAAVTFIGGNSTLASGENRAGLEVPEGCDIQISGTAGSGLTAIGGENAAGIGGGNGQAAGTISITGQDTVVNAQGGAGGAGIGGGNLGSGSGSGDMIDIRSAIVTSVGGTGAAGIGGGQSGDGGIIHITGSQVAATGGSGGAGIGSGTDANDGGEVVVSEASVTAMATGGGRDIGPGAGCTNEGTLRIGLDEDGNFDSFAGRAILTLSGSGANEASTTIGTCTILGDAAGSLAGLYIEGVRQGDPSPQDRVRRRPSVSVTTTISGDSIINSVQATLSMVSGTVSANVSGDMMDALLAQAKSTGGTRKGDIIEVLVSPVNAESLSTTVPRRDLADVVSSTQSSFAVRSPFVSVTLDHWALETIVAAGQSARVAFSARVVSQNDLTDAQRDAVGDQPVFDLTVINGDVQVSHLGGGSATVKLPYTLQPDENPGSIVAYFLSGDGTLEALGGVYDAQEKVVVFHTTHFSKFTIGHSSVGFVDVPADAPYRDAVLFLAARGITSGTGAGTFSPGTPVTRAQFLVLLMNAHEVSPERASEFLNTEPFADAGSNYYSDYLLVAKGLGIATGIAKADISGADDNYFLPQQAITRQEALVMMYNTFKVIDSAQGLDALMNDGILDGPNGLLHPTSTITRAEAAMMLYRILSR